jgi:hypothetical protein
VSILVCVGRAHERTSAISLRSPAAFVICAAPRFLCRLPAGDNGFAGRVIEAVQKWRSAYLIDAVVYWALTDESNHSDAY